MVDKKPTRWERRHTNGWMAIVTPADDGTFNASAHEVGVPNAPWAVQHIDDLAAAQQIADDRVPKHECTCAGWLGLY